MKHWNSMDQGAIISYLDKERGRVVLEVKDIGIPGAPITVVPYTETEKTPYSLIIDKEKEVQEEKLREPGQWHRLTLPEVVALNRRPKNQG